MMTNRKPLTRQDMKRLVLPHIEGLEQMSFGRLCDIMEREAVRQGIDCVNWREYPYCPIVSFDAAYSDYIREPGLPHTIYEIEGAEYCAIEINSFSKNAGFTGVRLGWSIVPETLRSEDDEPGLIHRLWNRRQTTFFNGASNIAQAGGLAALSAEGRAECRFLVDYYLGNAKVIKEGLEEIGITCYGGVNSPYIWAECPFGMKSWDFFDLLLEKAHVVVTPGSGFGPAGEGYVRLSSYGHREDITKAVDAIKEALG